MTNILVVTKRFYPPWSDGTVSYAKGFVESVLEAGQSREDLKVTVLSLTDKWFYKLHRDELKEYLKEKPIDFKCFYSGKRSSKIDVLRLLKKLSRDSSYQLLHIIYDALDPISIRLRTHLTKESSVIKHVLIYPVHTMFNAQKAILRFLEKSNLLNMINVKFSVSSDILRKLYGLREAIVIPPAIDTELYKPINTKCLNSDTTVKILSKAKIRFGDLKSVLSRDILVLYMGPLVPERFNSKNILKSISNLKKEFSIDIGLMAVGRGFEETDHMRELRHFAKKYNLDGRVFFCLRNLTEKEKMHLLNEASIFIDLFQPKLTHASVVFPPLVLLESMSVSKAVVAGGLPYLDTLIRNYENGILIKNVVDEKAIVNGIWNAIINMEKLSKNARTTITSRYSIKEVSKTYLKFLNTYEV